MAGTRAGGLAAAVTNKKKYGKGFYASIGSKGGKLGNTGGFYQDKKRARTAGSIGGKLSIVGLKFSSEKQGIRYYRDARNKVHRFTVDNDGRLVPYKVTASSPPDPVDK